MTIFKNIVQNTILFHCNFR